MQTGAPNIACKNIVGSHLPTTTQGVHVAAGMRQVASAQLLGLLKHLTATSMQHTTCRLTVTHSQL